MKMVRRQKATQDASRFLYFRTRPCRQTWCYLTLCLQQEKSVDIMRLQKQDTGSGIAKRSQVRRLEAVEGWRERRDWRSEAVCSSGAPLKRIQPVRSSCTSPPVALQRSALNNPPSRRDIPPSPSLPVCQYETGSRSQPLGVARLAPTTRQDVQWRRASLQDQGLPNGLTHRTSTCQHGETLMTEMVRP